MNKHYSCCLELYYTEKYGMSDYRHNFHFEESISDNQINNFYIGFQHNSARVENLKQALVIEFNPNKCIFAGVLLDILHNFFNFLPDVHCNSFDFAIDLKGIKISQLVFDKERKVRVLDFRNSGSRTLYIGFRGSHCSCKVYDKASEQGIVGEDWTRVEYTIKPDMYLSDILNHKYDLKLNLPTVYFVNSFDDIGINYKCYLLCIMRSDVVINDFSYRTRINIKNILDNSDCICIDNKYSDVVYDTLSSFVNKYKAYVSFYNDTEKVDVDGIFNGKGSACTVSTKDIQKQEPKNRKNMSNRVTFEQMSLDFSNYSQNCAFANS